MSTALGPQLDCKEIRSDNKESPGDFGTSLMQGMVWLRSPNQPFRGEAVRFMEMEFYQRELSPGNSLGCGRVFDKVQKTLTKGRYSG